MLISPPKRQTPDVKSAYDAIPALYFESIGLLYWDTNKLLTFPLYAMTLSYMIVMYPLRVYYLINDKGLAGNDAYMV